MKTRLATAAIAAAVVIADRVTKLYIRSAFSPVDLTPVIPGFFNIVHTENPGAAFGIFSESHSTWSAVFLGATSLIVMGVIGFMLWRPRAAPKLGLVSVGLALVFGGAAGNVWDRIFRGTVTDFLQLFFGS